MRNHHRDWTMADIRERLTYTPKSKSVRENVRDREIDNCTMKRIQSCGTSLYKRNIHDPLWSRIVDEASKMAEEVCGGGEGWV